MPFMLRMWRSSVCTCMGKSFSFRSTVHIILLSQLPFSPIFSCRVIQKAIRSLEQEDVSKLVTEFNDKVITFIYDPNGNHVIQRCIQVMSAFAKASAEDGNPDLAQSLSDQLQFIIDDIVANVEKLSSHRYGCRVVQRAIEHCVEEQKDAVLDALIVHHKKLLIHQYGNYGKIALSIDHISQIF